MKLTARQRNSLRLTIVVGVVVALGVGVGCLWQRRSRPAAASPLATLRVLFIGNSFTSVNDLPKMVSDVAASRGYGVDFDMSAPGGYRFSQHVTDQSTLSKINAKAWDYVVLQEQSELPTFPDNQLSQETTPYAAQLVNLIHQHNPASKVILFETWGYKNGDSNNCQALPYDCAYSSMQDRLRQTYAQLAGTTGSGEALVGEAWKNSQALHPEIDLYASDGKHPSAAGTYLAACVFYEALFHKSPVGAARLTLPAAEAKTLQSVAAAR